MKEIKEGSLKAETIRNQKNDVMQAKPAARHHSRHNTLGIQIWSLEEVLKANLEPYETEYSA